MKNYCVWIHSSVVIVLVTMVIGRHIQTNTIIKTLERSVTTSRRIDTNWNIILLQRLDMMAEHLNQLEESQCSTPKAN